jgi:sortase A
MATSLRKILFALQNLFLLVGALLVSYCLFMLVSAWVYQFRQSKELDALIRRQTAPPPRSSLTAGAMVGRLTIPRLDLQVMVVEGAEQGELGHAAGHIENTALPGAHGNVGIAGHRDSYFEPLKNIRKNDTIYFQTPQGEYRYHVVSTEIVRPNNVGVLAPQRGQDSLTLVTCYPFTYIGLAPNRFIVKANLVTE